MSTSHTTASALSAISADIELVRLEHFAWLIDNAGDDRSAIRLAVLWRWADEMVDFQNMANRTGEPVEYVQRGKTLRILYPQTDREAA